MISQIFTSLIQINNLFNEERYEIYLVGGCVRDMIMGQEIKDYDLTTNATPKQMIEMFNKHNIVYYPTGEKYGTVTVLIDDIPFEITTYRADGKYSDGRRPDNVVFSSSLEDDLARRDFTMNAMAILLDDFIASKYAYDILLPSIIDPFNGIEDIKNETIKAIRDPNERFREDGLRILRAIRFAIKYEFKIDKDTMNAIWKNHSYLDNVSIERIQNEFNQMLLYFNRSDYSFNLSDKFQYKYSLMSFVVKRLFPQMRELAQTTHNSVYHLFDIFTHSLLVCSNVESTLPLKLAALFHDIGKVECKTYDEEKLTNHFYHHAKVSADIAAEILHKFRYSNDIISNVITLILVHDNELKNNKKSIKRLLSKVDENQFYKLLDLKLADRLNHLGVNTVKKEIEYFNNIKDTYKEIKNSNEIFSIKDLAINGNDLKKLGFEEGPYIGKLLNDCLQECIEHPEHNIKEYLLEYIYQRN